MLSDLVISMSIPVYFFIPQELSGWWFKHVSDIFLATIFGRRIPNDSYMFQMFGHLEMIPHVTFRVLGHLAVHEDVNAVKSAGSQRNDVGSPAEFSGREKLFEFLLKHMDTVLVGFLGYKLVLLVLYTMPITYGFGIKTAFLKWASKAHLFRVWIWWCCFFSFSPIFMAFYWGCVFGCVLLLDISVKQQKHTKTRIVLEIGTFCMYWHCRCCLSCRALRQCHGCDRTSNHQPMEGTWLIEWHPDLLHSQALAFQKAWFCLDPVGWNCLNLTNCIQFIAVVD